MRVFAYVDCRIIRPTKDAGARATLDVRPASSSKDVTILGGVDDDGHLVPAELVDVVHLDGSFLIRGFVGFPTSILPGLIDSHVHVTASSANLRMPSTMPASLVYARSVPILRGMLRRGFTTVRDCGGADHGLATAIDEGTLEGPRLVYGGKALSQTGGHGDFRAAGDNALASGACRCCDYTIGRVCDGVAACREAVRDEVRKGASHVKIMASGGVASPTDRLENLQFSEEEILAVVEEAKNAGIYVAAHAYTDRAVSRAIRCGVRTVEHGNFASRETLERLRDAGGFLVPTLVTYERLLAEGVRGGMPPELVAKVGDLVEAGQKTLATATRARVDVCYGSDLLGDMHPHQARSIALHLDAGVEIADALASMTDVPGRMLRPPRGLKVGRLDPGYKMDFIVVDGEPDRDPTILMDEARVRFVVKDGEVVVARKGDGCVVEPLHRDHLRGFPNLTFAAKE